MIEDLSEHPEGTTFEADVAIVGAGAAGITLARSLLAANLKVCLLESGGKDYEQPVQDLAEGESVGFPYYELKEARLRFFGARRRSGAAGPPFSIRSTSSGDPGWPTADGPSITKS